MIRKPLEGQPMPSFYVRPMCRVVRLSSESSMCLNESKVNVDIDDFDGFEPDPEW